MVTNRLRQFQTVVETQNLRKAAELLGISHSGLSKSMKVLEVELGFKLLLPSGRGIAITDQGKKLYERSEKFFVEFEKLIGNSEDSEREVLRMGSFEVFTSQFLGKIFRERIYSSFPNLELEVHELVPGKLEEALILNKIDIGITYEPIPRKGIDYIHVSTHLMGCFALKGAFRGKDVLELPFAAPVNPLEGTPSGVKGLDAWPESRFERKVPFRVDLMATGLELVRQGLCVIFIPQFVAYFHNECVKERFHLEPLALPKGMNPVKRKIYLVKRESTEEESLLRVIAKALRDLPGM